jgi:sugar lactone lactonase YvrE
MFQTSGIGIDRSVTPHTAYVVSDVSGVAPFISKYNAATGSVMTGLRNTFPTALTRIGDIQFDTTGHLFAVQKVGAGVYALNKATGTSLNSDGSPIWSGGGGVKRGIGVSPDGNTVYVADESQAVVWKLTGTASGLGSTIQTYSGVTFKSYTPVATGLSEACEVDGAGNVYISIGINGAVEIYKADGTFQETVGNSTTATYGADTNPFIPRGVAFSSTNMANNTLYIARFTTVMKATYPTSGPVAVFKPQPTAVENWMGYSF